MQLHIGPHGKPAAASSLLGFFYINATENSYGEAKTKRMVKPNPKGRNLPWPSSPNSLTAHTPKVSSQPLQNTLFVPKTSPAPAAEATPATAAHPAGPKRHNKNVKIIQNLK